MAAGDNPNLASTEALVTIAGRALAHKAEQISTGGDNSILTAVADKHYHIRAIMINNAGGSDVSVYVKITQGGSAVKLYPVLLKAGSIFSKKVAPDYYETDVNTAVIINLSDAVAVNYQIDYGVA